MPELDQLLTARQVGEFIQRDHTTVLWLFRTGKLSGYRLGHHGVRFSIDDVRSYLDAHRVEAS
jgi:hypothetical protein